MLKTFAQNNYQRLYSATNRHAAGQEDLVGLVGFHDRAFVVAKPTSSYSPWLQERGRQLHDKIAGSTTNITPGLREAINLLRRAPKGMYRRLWLLSDGYPNREESLIDSVVHEAKSNWININTVGIDEGYDEAVLKRISSATHNGKFIPIANLRELTDALTAGTSGYGAPRKGVKPQRVEMTIFAIDLSPSMTERMADGRTRIAAVEEAILHLLKYKQTCFA